jgi:hypothetical protein
LFFKTSIATFGHCLLLSHRRHFWLLTPAGPQGLVERQNVRNHPQQHQRDGGPESPVVVNHLFVRLVVIAAMLIAAVIVFAVWMLFVLGHLKSCSWKEALFGLRYHSHEDAALFLSAIVA